MKILLSCWPRRNLCGIPRSLTGGPPILRLLGRERRFTIGIFKRFTGGPLVVPEKKFSRDLAGNGFNNTARNAVYPATKFTLIELLVVIAVIGILASLLLPSLSKARVKAYASLSISNMKQIGNAFMIYAADEDGNLPPSRYPSGSKAAWPEHVKAIMNLEDTHNVLSHPGVGFPSNVQRTYGITMAVLGISPNGWFDDRIPRKVHNLEKPSLTHLLTETKLQSANNGKWRLHWGQTLGDLNSISPTATQYLDFPYDNSHHLLNGDISVITRKFSQRLQITEARWKGYGY